MLQLPSIQTLICILHKCRKEKNLAYVKCVHAHISNNKIEVHRVVGNYVVPVLVGCDSVFDAHHIFNSLVQRNVYSWTSLMSGHVECGQPSYAFILYQKMQEEYIPPSSYTIMVLLRACARLKDIKKGRELHKEAVTKGFEKNIIVGNTLLDMYAKCGLLAEAQDVFMHLPVRDVVSWNVLLSGYVENELCQEALKYFEKMQSEGFLPDEITFVCSLRACGGAGSVKKGREMHSEIEKMGFEGEIYVGNTLVDMYAKCGSLAEALEVFDKLPIRTVVSWNALVAGYMENGLSREVLKCVEVMQLEGTSPDAFTYACSLKACSSIGAVNRARQLHGEVRRNGLEGDPFLRSTLIDMYGKCGSLAEACKTFVRAPMRDVALWNAMINVYGTNHEGIMAMQCFGDMQRCNIKPDSITFTCLLTACSRTGLVCQGQEYFRTMREHYGIDATIDHYTCMVDLLARSGYLFQAEQLLETILSVPSIKTWTALLSACKIYGEAKLALTCFQHLAPLNPTAASYVLLSSIYASAGRWEDASRIEELRKHMGAKKKPAMALIEVNKKVHEFVVGDIKCQSKEAISMLENLNSRMKKEGYIPILDLVLKPLSLEEKEEAMCGHAEKLAIAFGLLHTPQGQALYVTKNLRMCDDCHNAAKIISRIERREIILREASWVHHFKDGLCKCGRPDLPEQLPLLEINLRLGLLDDSGMPLNSYKSHHISALASLCFILLYPAGSGLWDHCIVSIGAYSSKFKINLP